MTTTVGSAGGVGLGVHDTGVGIAEEANEKRFEPFFATKDDGLGMGLAVSRSIIEAHGGRIRATSNPDRGATVSFTLPGEGTQVC